MTDFKVWWSKQNGITLRMAPPEVIAKAAWNAGREDMRATGTTCTFTVPVGTKKITITFESVDIPEIEIKDSKGIETSGYIHRSPTLKRG